MRAIIIQCIIDGFWKLSFLYQFLNLTQLIYMIILFIWNIFTFFPEHTGRSNFLFLYNLKMIIGGIEYIASKRACWGWHQICFIYLLSIILSTYIYLSVNISAFLYNYLSVCLSIYLHIRPSIYLSIFQWCSRKRKSTLN